MVFLNKFTKYKFDQIKFKILLCILDTSDILKSDLIYAVGKKCLL